MATLIPSLNSVLSRMTTGEKRLGRRLESHLEDDYLCWYDVPVGSGTVHPDFVVLHPRRGILILEVKDWRLDTIQSIDRASAALLTSGGVKHVANPLEQARQYAHAVSAVLQKDPALRVEEGAHQVRLTVKAWIPGRLRPQNGLHAAPKRRSERGGLAPLRRYDRAMAELAR